MLMLSEQCVLLLYIGSYTKMYR